MGVRKKVTKLLTKLPKTGRRSTEQAGAVCWRVSSSRIEILLITSKDTGRWIIPKGNIRRREPSFRAAQREALEESGVSGKIRKTTVGYYRYAKNEETSLTVAVHLLKCSEETDAFAEQGQRSKIWVSPAAAAVMVDEPELRQILANIDQRTVLASQDRTRRVTESPVLSMSEKSLGPQSIFVA